MKHVVKTFFGYYFQGEGKEQLDDIINEYAKKNNLNPINVTLLSNYSGTHNAAVTVIFEQA